MEVHMSLKEILSKMKQESIASKPPEQVAIMREATEELIASGVTENALKAGEKWVDFSLPDEKGTIVHSKELLAKGPLVVCFYRGVW